MTYTNKLLVATGTYISKNILRELAKDANYLIRADVANNPNTPDDVLWDLAMDKDGKVRQSIARNPKSSSNLLIKLFEYEKNLKAPLVYVIEALYNNDKLPSFAKKVIETLYENWV